MGGLFAIVVALMVCGARAEAQQPKQVPRIGYLTITGSGLPPVFVKGLRDLGYVEGKNIAFVFRTAEGKYERYSNVLAELVHLNVDIIVVSGGIRAITAAKNATKTIPIIMGGAGIDPVVSGLVESLARPGGNVTGITNLSRELGGKRLDLLKEAVPKVAHVAVL